MIIWIWASPARHTCPQLFRSKSQASYQIIYKYSRMSIQKMRILFRKKIRILLLPPLMNSHFLTLSNI